MSQYTSHCESPSSYKYTNLQSAAAVFVNLAVQRPPTQDLQCPVESVHSKLLLLTRKKIKGIIIPQPTVELVVVQYCHRLCFPIQCKD